MNRPRFCFNESWLVVSRPVTTNQTANSGVFENEPLWSKRHGISVEITISLSNRKEIARLQKSRPILWDLRFDTQNYVGYEYTR